MRRIRYSVAASLDGYIAGPQGEYDWIIMDPEIDFAAGDSGGFGSEFQTMGSPTYFVLRLNLGF